MAVTSSFPRWLTLFFLVLLTLFFSGCQNADTPADPTTAPTAVPTDAADSTPAPGIVIDENAYQLTYDLDKTFQEIEGFGAAFTWYANTLFDNPNYEEILDLLFSDAKLSILRFKNEYGYQTTDMTNCVELRYYEAAQARAEARGETMKVLFTSWSPAAYLKEGNDINGGHTLAKDANGNYRYEDFGNWWRDSVLAYEKAGIPIDVISIQNEVDFEASYDGCEFEPTETTKGGRGYAAYADAYLATYYALQAAMGEDAPAMLGPETMSCEPTTIQKYMEKVIAEAPESIYGIAHHLYLGGISTDEPNYCNADSFLMPFMGLSNKYFGQYKLWQTEFYRGTALQTAEVINNSLVYENLNAYIYWSGIWYCGNQGDINDGHLVGISGAIPNWTTPTGYVVGGDYYALRHFSEFIRPGYYRVEAALDGTYELRSSMFASPDYDKLVIVMINTATEECNVQLPLADYTVTGSQIYQSVMVGEEYTYDDLYHDLGSLPDNRILTLPGESVTTVAIEGSRNK